MAIVNNPHNIQDIDKQYKTWVKLGKPTGVLIMSNGGWFPSTETYFAREWLEDFVEYSNGLRNKYRTKIENMQYRLKEDYLRNVDFTNTSRFKKVFYTSEDANYTFEIHAYSIEELMGNSDDNGAILNNNGLAELRIYVNGETNPSNIIKIASNDRTDNFRANDYDREVLPGKFTFCMINPKNEITDIEFDHKYTLDGLVFIVGYGLTGNFINVTQKQSNPRIPSLNGDSEPTENITSTDLLKVPSVSDNYFFTDRSKQRNAICIDNKGGLIGNAWIFDAGEYKNRNVVDYTLFSNFKLNTEFLTNIIAPFADYVAYNRNVDAQPSSNKQLFNNKNSNNYRAIKNITMYTIRFDNCKIVAGLFYGIPLQNDKFQELINSFDFLGGDKIEKILALFSGMNNITTLDLSNIIFPLNCKEYRYLFSDNTGITYIKFNNHFKEMVTNVENFRENFSNCYNLKKIENLSLNMPKCKSFKGLFEDCRSLENNINQLDIKSTDKESVDLSRMFYNCSKLSGVIDLSKVRYIKSINSAFCSTGTNGSVPSIKFSPGTLNTASNTSEKKMDKDALVDAFFQTKVNSIEHLEDLDAPEIESMKETFKGINGIRDINLPNFKMEGVKSLEGTFAWGYYGLRSIRIPKVEKLNPDITTMANLFSACRTLETLDFPPLTRQNNPQNTKKLTDINGILSGCSVLNIPIYITNLDTSNVTTLQNAFCTYNTQGTDIIGIEDLNTSNVQIFSTVFGSNIKNKPILDLRKWNVSKGTNFYSIFNRVGSEIDITGWDVSKLVYGRGFFAQMDINSLDKIKGLETLNFSSVNSGNPCYNESYNISTPEYIMSELGGIDSMFAHMPNLINFTIPNCLKNLPNITSLYEFFESGSRLQTADFTGCHYDIIKNIGRLCEFCYELRTIDLTSLNLKIRCGAYAFKSCINLREIKGTLVFDESITEDQSKYLLKEMFKECNSLSNLKVKNIPGNNKTLFETVTGIRSNQYTVVS